MHEREGEFHLSCAVQASLTLDPDTRPSCAQLQSLEFFQRDGWAARCLEEIRARVHKEMEQNPLLRDQLDLVSLLSSLRRFPLLDLRHSLSLLLFLLSLLFDYFFVLFYFF